jgi:glycosyltransferase involved in cell wall biosynthesis
LKVPEVSLILPTQGARASLLVALRSALAQDFASLELLVVDDAAAETNWTRAPELAGLLADPRVRLVPFHQSRGCAAAKNAGLRAARGRWVCYLDDDNEYRPGKIRAQHAAAVASGCPVVLCGIEFRAHGRRRLRQVDASTFAGDALLLDALPDTNALFHLREASPAWDESLGTVDDACLFQALLVQHGLKSVPNVPEPLLIYNAHGGERANREWVRLYRGQRRLLVRWSHGYSLRARRVQLLRSLIAFCKFEPGRWGRFAACGWRLVRVGGAREWRVVANAAGVKLPLVRRWMVT